MIKEVQEVDYDAVIERNLIEIKERLKIINLLEKEMEEPRRWKLVEIHTSPTWEKCKFIIADVCQQVYGITNIKRQIKLQEYVFARYCFMHIAKVELFENVSLTELGDFLGGLDHSTVINGLKRFDDMYETSQNFRETYYEILNRLSAEGIEIDR